MRANRAANQLRIIAGRWRGRKLAFAPVPGLRPTPDRVRETLFNWLSPVIGGAHCLDLFAGSGALGFEAASRGAARVLLVDSDAAVVAALCEQQARLQATQVEVLQADARTWLAGNAQAFDVVFLDPPFRLALLPDCLELLDRRGWLAPGAYIYIESERHSGITLPSRWVLQRSKTAGQVDYCLAQVPRD